MDTDKIDCGDTEFCDDCSVNEATKDEPRPPVKSLTKNAKGHCDFYDGSKKVRHDTTQ